MYISEKIKSRENNFDAIRFFAAVFVIFSHSFLLLGKTEPYRWVSGYATFGNVAVNTFFVLSGFLIIKSWMDKPIWFVYLKKRILRIFPALVVAVVLTVLFVGPLVSVLRPVEYFLDPITHKYLQNIFLSVQFFLPGVFLNNIYDQGVNGSLWTLPIEFKFYIFVLILGIFNFFRNKAAVLCLVVGLFCVAIINTYFPHQYGIGFLNKDMLRCLIYFSMGILFYLYQDKIRISRFYFVISLVFLIATFRTSIGSTISYLFLPYIVICAGFWKINKLNIVSKYGDFSYGLYIYAFPVQQYLIYISKNNITVFELFAYSFLITLFFAIFSWFFIEKPSLKLKNVSFYFHIKMKYKNFLNKVSFVENEI